MCDVLVFLRSLLHLKWAERIRYALSFLFFSRETLQNLITIDIFLYLHISLSISYINILMWCSCISQEFVAFEMSWKNTLCFVILIFLQRNLAEFNNKWHLFIFTYIFINFIYNYINWYWQIFISLKFKNYRQ